MLAVPYNIRDGRRHLNFESSDQQRLYDALFQLGQPGGIGFDIADPAHLHRLGIWNPEKNVMEFPFRFTDRGMVERSLRMFRYERVDGYLKEDRSLCRTLCRETVDHEEYQRRCRERAEDMTEVYLRRYLPGMSDSRLALLDPKEEREAYIIQPRLGQTECALTVVPVPKPACSEGLFGWRRQ